MKIFSLLALLCGTLPTLAQTIVSVAPGRNATALLPTVTATLSTPPAGTATLKVFGSLAGGLKAGTTTLTSSAIQFAPTVAFQPGELLTAVYTGGAAGTSQAWQFTGAATGGSGQLSLGSQVATSFDYYSYEGLVRLADVDNDGDLDLLTMGYSNLPVSTQLLVKLNNGQGVFTPGWSTTVPMSSAWQWKCQLEMADVDNDGDLDILCGGASGYVYTYANNGSGTFVLQSSSSTNLNYNMAIGDIDADGDLDFVQTTVGPSSHVTILSYVIGLNNGAGNFAISRPINTVNNPVIKGLQDLDNNGTLDILEEASVTTVPPPGGTASTYLAVSARFNGGQGSFGVPQVLTTVADSLYSCVSADVDSDNDLDLIGLVRRCTTCTPRLKIFLNDGSGHFGNPTALFNTGLTFNDKRLVTTDLTGDGKPDLLVTSSFDSVKVLRNLGNGTFERAKGYRGSMTTHTLAAPAALAWGDLDGDGDIDVAAPFNSGSPSINLLFNANAALATTAQTPLLPMQVWPNPASGNLLYVGLPASPLTGELRLTTVLGQTVRTQPIIGPVNELPLKGLSPGLYILSVQPLGQPLVSRRVVVQ